MRDVIKQANSELQSGRPLIVATVVDVSGSAPRLPGTSMVVMADGAVVGSLSGGCVEGAVYAAAEEAAMTRKPTSLSFGVTDESAFAAGLTCGGTIDIFVQHLDERAATRYASLERSAAGGVPIALATVVKYPDASVIGRQALIGAASAEALLDISVLDRRIHDDTRGLLAAGQNGLLTYGPDATRLGNETEVFVESFVAKPRMLVFGATDFAAALVRIGAGLGFAVTVCDARETFTTPDRFPAAHDVVVSQPHTYLRREDAAGRIDDRTAICVVTHDPKFDIPLLETALRLEHQVYVGAMGSRRTHRLRIDRLVERGLAPELLSQLHSPIGLDIGARTPDETAVSIAAEIIRHRTGGGTGQPLRATQGPIHHPSKG